MKKYKTEKQKAKRREFVDHNISIMLIRVAHYLYEESNMQKYGTKHGEYLQCDEDLIRKMRTFIITQLNLDKEEFYPSKINLFGEKV